MFCSSERAGFHVSMSTSKRSVAFGGIFGFLHPLCPYAYSGLMMSSAISPRCIVSQP